MHDRWCATPMTERGYCLKDNNLSALLVENLKQAHHHSDNVANGVGESG
jgi:hypothetical protein